MAITVRDMSKPELEKLLDESRRELVSLRFNYALARSLQNPSRVRLLKRTVARILTIQREKELATIEAEKATDTLDKSRKEVEVKKHRHLRKKGKDNK